MSALLTSASLHDSQAYDIAYAEDLRAGERLSERQSWWKSYPGKERIQGHGASHVQAHCHNGEPAFSESRVLQLINLYIYINQ